MDGSSFDRITRRLAVATSRRGGVAALVAGALGIAGISAAEASRGAGRRHEKLACRNDQSECTAHEQCCSGICKLKPGSGTEYRCVGKKKKKDKDKKDEDKDTGGDGTCGISQDRCTQASECCGDLLCDLNSLRCCVQVNNTCEVNADCCDPNLNLCISGTCSLAN